jgi:hypothetical protein
VALFLAIGGVCALLISTSIVTDLFFASPAQKCCRDVRGLLDELESKKLDTDRWRREWESVDRRCGFATRADVNGPATYDRLAWVHRSLGHDQVSSRDASYTPRDRADDHAALRRMLDEISSELEQERSR